MADFIPFEDSRRLTGCNLYFDGVGAVLETQGAMPDEATLRAWDEAVQRAGNALGWSPQARVVRRHASGASLALVAPLDQLFSATEVNEWAWCRAHEARHGAMAVRDGMRRAIRRCGTRRPRCTRCARSPRRSAGRRCCRWCARRNSAACPC